MGIIVDPAQLDIVIYQGATWRQSFQWLYGPDAESAVPLDLSAAIVRAQVRNHYQSAEPYLSLSTADDTILADASGNIEIVVSAEDTADLLAVECVWDLEVEWDDGDVCRLLMGRAVISPEVTKDA